jgi:hypothetical protein
MNKAPNPDPFFLFHVPRPVLRIAQRASNPLLDAWSPFLFCPQSPCKHRLGLAEKGWP